MAYAVAYRDAAGGDSSGMPWVLGPFDDLEAAKGETEELKLLLCKETVIFLFPDVDGEGPEINWDYVYSHQA